MSFSYIILLFKKHKKHLPERLKGTFIGEFCRYGFMIFLSAWILQGVRITNWREVVIRYAIDIILMAIMISFGVHWALAFFIAHSINFTLNGQLFAMYTHMGATGVKAEKFLNDTIKMSKMIEKHKFIRASIAYGSLSRATAFYAVWLRTWAFFVHYPLDMYCYDPKVVVKKMRSDELPIMVNERDKCMMQWYPERVEFDEFIKIFTEANIK